jgi:uncharacterized repeat protein (TIGR03803 family)
MKPRVRNLFRLVVCAAAIVSASSAWAGDTVQYNFAGSPGTGPDGAYSYSTPINDKYGNLYGTTSQGGTHGYGTVFVLCAPGAAAPDLYPCTTGLTSWEEFVLYSFKGPPSSDGANPYGSLVFNGFYVGRKFTLYGTTFNGGNAKKKRCQVNHILVGCGTVFEVCAPSNFGGCGGVNLWQEHVLHRFVGGHDGSHPFGGLITDKTSDLFGTTTSGGGVGSCIGSSGVNEFCGTVFKLKGPSPWTFPETILHRFAGGTADGATPYAALCCNTIYTIPYLYGTAVNDGSGSAGVVFRVKNAGGFPETILYNFCSVTGCPDGANPYSDVIFDTSGNLYGTAFNGGSSGVGLAYKLTPGGPPWTETVLYSFMGGTADGANPTAGLMFDSLGNLYGTTLSGGPGCGGSCGTVFELTPAGPPWTETMLYSFLGGTTDGSGPWAGVTYDPPFSTTDLFGATVNAGADAFGTVYSVP